MGDLGSVLTLGVITFYLSRHVDAAGLVLFIGYAAEIFLLIVSRFLQDCMRFLGKIWIGFSCLLLDHYLELQSELVEGGQRMINCGCC